MLLLAFNLVFLVIGFAFLAIGIYGLQVFKSFLTFAPSNYIYIPTICIGAFLVLVGALSLWCTPKGVTWLLYLYGLIVFVLFVALVGVSTLFMVKRDAFEHTLKLSIENSIKFYPENAQAVDLMQSTIKCCGSDNYTDWFKTTWANEERRVPKSCCNDLSNLSKCKNENITMDNLSSDIYHQGCFRKLFTSIEDNYALIGGVGYATSVIVLTGSFLACLLAQNVRKNRYDQML